MQRIAKGEAHCSSQKEINGCDPIDFLTEKDEGSVFVEYSYNAQVMIIRKRGFLFRRKFYKR